MQVLYKKINLIFGLSLLLTLTTFAQFQNALDFDNIDDLVMVPNGSAGIAAGEAMSMTAWVLPINPNPGWPDFDGILGFRNEFSAGFYILHLNATTVELRFRNSLNEVFTFEYQGVTVGLWQHMALTYDGSMMHFYLNGDLKASLPATGNLESPSETFWIGSLPFQNNPFHLRGQIDEVSLWNKALSEEELTCIYQNDIDPESNNLVLYYKMNQGIAGQNNGGITNLIDETGTVDGQLMGFSLNGSSSNFVNGISNSTNLEETICEGESFEVGGQTFNSTGIYSISVETADGCDSLINLILFVESFNAEITSTDNVLTAASQNASYQWVDCDNNFEPIAGAIGQTFTPTDNGNYAVVVSSGNCEAMSDCVNVTGVGINDQSLLAKLKVFPNPVSEELFIEFSGMVKMQELEIRSITGEILLERKSINAFKGQINLNDLPSGIYYLDILFEEGDRVVKRMVKN